MNGTQSERSLSRHGVALPPVRVITAVLVAGVLFSGSASLAAPTSSPLRLAMIAGEGNRAPEAAVLGLVENDLLAMPDVAWVEREQVAAALKELALAANLDASQRTLQLGRILPADLFVFVEGLSGTQSRLFRVSVVETWTAIVFASWIGEPQELQQPAALLAAVSQAITKARIPVGQRRAFSLLGCHSDEPGRTLDPLAQTLGELLLHDLGALTNCVILDRAHCQRIREEESLAGIRKELAPSLFLLELGIGKGASAREILATVAWHAIQSNEPRRISVSLPCNDLPHARRALTEAVAACVGIQAGTLAAIGAEVAEARIFRRTAELMASQKNGEETVKAAEAEYALQPSEETAGRLTDAYNLWAYSLRTDSPSTVEKRQMLLVQIRERELEYDLLRLEVEGSGTNRGERLFWPRRRDSAGSEQRLTLNPGEEELQELLREKVDWEQRLSRYALDHAIPGSWAYFNELERIIRYGRHWSQTPQDFAALYRGVFVSYFDVPACTNAPCARFNFLAAFIAALQPNARVKEADYRRAVVGVFRWAAQEAARRSDLPLQVAALTAIAETTGEAETAESAAKDALNVLTEKMPIVHPDRNVPPNDDQWAAMAFIYAFSGLTNNEDRLRYCDQLLSPVIESGDAVRLDTWEYQVMQQWLGALKRAQRLKEALAVCERGVQRLDARPTEHAERSPRYEYAFRSMRDRLSREATALRIKAGLAPSGIGAPFVSVPVGPAPEGMSELAAMERQQDDLLLFWTGVADKSGTAVALTQVSARGGTQELLARTVLPLQKITVSAVAVNGPTVYVGLRACGLLICKSREHPICLNEMSGLPGDTVQAVACVAGRVFVSVGQKLDVKAGWRAGADFASGGLYEFDPRANMFTQIASSRATQSRHGLDGGRAYSIASLTPDELRQCLWLAVERNGRTEIWRYAPGDGTLTRIPSASAPSGGLYGMHTDGGAFMGATFNMIFEFDPERRQVRVIDDSFAFRWPCIRSGGALVSVRWGDLRLDPLDGKTPPTLDRTAKGTGPDTLWPTHLLRWNDREFLVGSLNGRVWRVTWPQ